MLNGRYQILEKIGEGSMGVVYRALDKSSNRLVAIKQCTLSTKNEKHVERFKREYQFLSQNKHKNIVQAFDLFKLENRYYLVLEYIVGMTLGDLIFDRARSISFTQQLDIAIQICDGIKFLNNRGIVHRDLKPDNIILTENYVPKILDMGIAKSQMSDMDSLTSAGKVVGTISYMSPEQFSHKDSSKIDVFSLAILFYQFFAWLPGSPFKGKNFSQTMQRILRETLPCFSIYTDKKDLHHKTVGNFLQLALQKHPSKRIGINKLHASLCVVQQTDDIEKLYNKSNELLAKTSKSRLKQYLTVCAIFVVTLVYLSSVSPPKKPDILSKNSSPESSSYKASLEYIKELHRTGKYAEAINYTDGVIEKNSQQPDLYRAYFYRAASYYRNKMYDNANRDYHKVLQLNSQFTQARLQLGATYAKQGLYRESLQQYAVIVKRKPNYAPVYYYRGITYFLMKKYDNSKDNFRRAAQLDKKYLTKIRRYFKVE